MDMETICGIPVYRPSPGAEVRVRKRIAKLLNGIPSGRHVGPAATGHLNVLFERVHGALRECLPKLVSTDFHGFLTHMNGQWGRVMVASQRPGAPPADAQRYREAGPLARSTLRFLAEECVRTGPAAFPVAERADLALLTDEAYILAQQLYVVSNLSDQLHTLYRHDGALIIPAADSEDWLSLDLEHQTA